MKKTIYIYSGVLLLILFACEKKAYKVFIEPEAKIEVSKTQVNINEAVYVKNLSKGESFSFWPGDKNHDYSKKSEGNKGLESNRGNDFEYSYDISGSYTLVVVASSFDEKDDKLTEKITQIDIENTQYGSLDRIEQLLADVQKAYLD